MTTGHDIAEAARMLLGTPFRHQGRDPDVGLDCVGLVVAAHAAVGLDLSGRTDYPRRPSADELRSALRRELRQVPTGLPWGPGDVLQIREGGGRYGRHTAVALGNGKMAVADPGSGVRVRTIRPEAVEGVFRHEVIG